MNRRASVLHVLGTGDRSGSGIARTLEHLADGLDRKRYSLAALVLRGDDYLPGQLREAGVPASHAHWTGTIRDPAGLSRFARALMESSPDIVHFHAGARLHRAIARSVTRARIVAHYHSLTEETGGGRRSIAGTHIVIANSGATAATLPGGAATVVYPGVRVGPIATGSPTQGSVIGVATRLAPVKGLQILLEALSLLVKTEEAPRIRLEIAGEGPEENRLKAEAGRLGVSRHVRFLGWRDDVRDLMRGWTLYSQPSLAEGFGISALEAMAEGLPVVATRVGGLTELIADGETGLLVPPGEPTLLAQAIASLCNDEALRFRMGRAGRARAARDFTIEREIAVIRSAYERLLA